MYKEKIVLKKRGNARMNNVLILREIIIKNTNTHTHTHGEDLIAIEKIKYIYTYLTNQDKMNKINVTVNDGYCLG